MLFRSQQAGEGLWRRTEGDLRRWAVKIDAPEWESSGLMDLGKLTDRYVEWLNRLSRLPAGVFLNDPTDIAEVLDKRRCKERLVQKGVPVTHMYGESFSHSEELFAFMREWRPPRCPRRSSRHRRSARAPIRWSSSANRNSPRSCRCTARRHRPPRAPECARHSRGS